MIACEGVGYAVRDGRGGSRTILQPLSYRARAGEVALVRGPSGAGKSTLLSIVAGVLRPTEGQVLFRGAPVSRYTAAHRDRFRSQVGLVAQGLHLFEELSAIENVLLPLVPGGCDRGAVERALSLLDTLDIPARQDVRVLSGGERQRVAIARALLREPPLLVLDEPTAHQDDRRAEIIAGLVGEALEREATVVVAAHDDRVERLLPVGTTVELRDGAMVER